jgi:hypothetical protein
MFTNETHLRTHIIASSVFGVLPCSTNDREREIVAFISVYFVGVNPLSVTFSNLELSVNLWRDLFGFWSLIIQKRTVNSTFS